MSSAGRPLPASTQGAAPPQRVSVEGVEIVQAVQDGANQVTLVAEKATVVRIYLRAEGAVALQARGQLQVSRAGVAPVVVASQNVATVDPADNGDLLKKRNNTTLGLNFVLPAQLTTAGKSDVRLISASDAQSGAPLDLNPATPQSFEFKAGPPLRLRLLGIRYRKPGSTQTFVPTQRDVDMIFSWLVRAYPVPRLVATYAVIDSNSTWPFESTDVNLQLAAVRAADMAGGGDPRTHYYGLVADNNFTQFMRGSASGIPQTPDPTVVASGPTGTHTWGWDFDGSYGDWYTAHELGHTFGRFHPGFCNGNSSNDPSFPYPNGQLTGSSPAYVGFDVGDANIGAPVAALPGTDWHDLMTYCSNQWLSAYTYEAIRRRLLQEDALAPSGGSGGTTPAAPATTEAALMTQPNQNISVVGSIDLDEKTGKLRYVQPIQTPPLVPTGDGPRATLVLKDDAGTRLTETEVPLTLESCTDADDHHHIGFLNVIIPSHPQATSLELLYEGSRLDTFAAASPPSQVTNIRKKSPPPPSALESALESSAPPTTELTWDSAEAADPGVTYTVQVRRDSSEPWQTVSVGRPTPEVNVDARQFAPRQKLQVKITATNGFRTTDVTESVIELN
jgi:hypothetical protein